MGQLLCAVWLVNATMAQRLISFAIGYICGLFQTAYLYGRLNNIDIRDHGSGNPGTTNALRTLGKKAGIITFIGDCLKCVLAVWIVRQIYGAPYPNDPFLYVGAVRLMHPGSIILLSMYAGIGAIIGHNYPFYLKFKGGKGIAATAGLMLAINPWMALIGAACFIVVVAATKYVSLGSLVLVVVFLVQVIMYGQMGGFGFG